MNNLTKDISVEDALILGIAQIRRHEDFKPWLIYQELLYWDGRTFSILTGADLWGKITEIFPHPKKDKVLYEELLDEEQLEEREEAKRKWIKENNYEIQEE